MQEHSTTPDDKVNFILVVGRLPLGPHRQGKGYVQRATAEDGNGVLAYGAWDACLRLDETENLATLWLAVEPSHSL